MFGKEPKGNLGQNEYHLLATSRTSTMEKEMNQAVKEGFSFKAVMGGAVSYTHLRAHET